MSALDVRAIAEKELKEKPCPKLRQEFRIVVAEEAFDRAVARGEADTTREVGGVLVGELLRDEAGPYLKVVETIDALHAEEKGAELTFTHATWEHINKEMDSRHAGKKIVGWYHTHPGFGIFLSDRDQFIHKSFFNLPFQVALVYDPKSREHGMFAWHESEPRRCRRYWVGAREHGWDGARLPPTSAEAAHEAGTGKNGGTGKDKPAVAREAESGAAASGSASDELGRDWLTLGALALFLILLAGFGGYWMGGRGAGELVRELEGEVIRARADGARAAVAGLDGQLLGILRATLGDEGVRRPAQQILDDLAEAQKTLSPPAGPSAAAPTADPKREEALARIRSARDQAQRLRDERSDAYRVLQQLEEAARGGATAHPAELARAVGEERSALGQLHLDLASDAAKAGDTRRARRYLATAAKIDPANRAGYERELQALDKNAATAPAAPPAGAAPNAATGAKAP